MRYFQVPANIEVRAPKADLARAGETITFFKYALGCWLDDTRAIAGGFSKQVRWAAVIEKFSHAEVGDWIELEDEDYATLRTIVEQPTTGWPPSVMVQLIPFSRVVLNAVGVKPSASAESPGDSAGAPS